MGTTRDQLQATLAVHDPEALRLILAASQVDDRNATTSADLAARIADAIWWNYSTPLGYLAERTTLEDIVRHVARRLRVSDRVDPDVPVWEQIRALTTALVATIPDDGVSVASLDDATRGRLSPSWMGALGWGGGATGSLATRWGSSKVLALLKTPIGRLLPLLPVVGPWVGAVRTGLAAVNLVTGPLGIAMTVMSLNSALGSNYRRLVPLVLGVGALGPQPVSDAQIVDDEVPASPLAAAVALDPSIVAADAAVAAARAEAEAAAAIHADVQADADSDVDAAVAALHQDEEDVDDEALDADADLDTDMELAAEMEMDVAGEPLFEGDGDDGAPTA